MDFPQMLLLTKEREKGKYLKNARVKFDTGNWFDSNDLQITWLRCSHSDFKTSNIRKNQII